MAYECRCEDPADVTTERMIKSSRRERRCCECGHGIRKGDPYHYTFAVWQGEAHTYVTCRHCIELRQWAVVSVPCFCWEYRDLHTSIRDMVDQVRRDVPGFFFEYGRRIVKAKRAKAVEAIAQ